MDQVRAHWLRRLRVGAIVLAVVSPVFLPGRAEAFAHLRANVRWVVPVWTAGYVLLWLGTIVMAVTVGRHGKWWRLPAQFIAAIQERYTAGLDGMDTPEFQVGFVASIVGPAVMVATELAGALLSLPAQALPFIALSVAANVTVVVWFRLAILNVRRRTRYALQVGA